VLKKLWLGDSGERISSAEHGTKLFLPPDPDDSWQMDTEAVVPSAQAKEALPNAGE
jgi:hypothetical protein